MLFVGLDVIGGFVTEINVTSPTGIRELEAKHGHDIGGMLIDAVLGAARAALMRAHGHAARARFRRPPDGHAVPCRAVPPDRDPRRSASRRRSPTRATCRRSKCCWSTIPLPDGHRNDSADYLAERTQQGSGNSPDGQTRRPSRGNSAGNASRARRTAAGSCLRPRDEAGGEGELLAEPRRRAALRRGRADPHAAPAVLPLETFAGSSSPFAGSDTDAELAAQGRAAPRAAGHAEHAPLRGRALSRRLEAPYRAGRHRQLPERRAPQQAVRQSGGRGRARLERRPGACRRPPLERLTASSIAPQWTY